MKIITSEKDKSKYWIIGGILISWLTIWIFLTSPIGFIVWMGILIKLISDKSNLKWYLILSAWIFIPGCNFVSGTFDYFRGNAELKGIGGPELYHGIDRETRVPSTSFGCIVIGFEPFVFIPNNKAVKLWTNLFGYQRGAYKGIYPDREESIKINEKGDTIKVNSANGKLIFNLSNIDYKLDSLEYYGYRFKSQLDSVVVSIVNEECLIFEELNEEINNNFVYLVDIEKEKLLTKYYKK